jgi:hypothetical protein
MRIKIESPDVISQVKSGDILLQTSKKEKYKVTQEKGNDFFILTSARGKIAL